ncbi:unnamed protein product [Acanthoscelides obtectus]|uniref:Leucine-rich repeat-containing protein 23 n=1 Tax=Acanthoscelides obtectus TaxID=200917 RepID=A0A9P0P227_ACAOB|nr:unnamed protein product [Acanthoscelides obtectus]CAK1622921.1 Leucine-rich repeat-containing protein 23 [Acanthoscelides obtectus]
MAAEEIDALEVHFGEGGIPGLTPKYAPTPHFDIVIKEKKLTFEEASRCLNTLGKDESGVRYAYLMLSATERKLTDISTVANFKHLLFIDVSGNYLNTEAMYVLTQVPFLLYLRAERNVLESAGFRIAPYLQVLILNMNQITETCDINQPMLELLELGENLIYTAQFDPEGLPNLKELSLHNNHLIDTSGVFPTSLEKLYLNKNKIMKINSNFPKLPNLTVLNLRDNGIRKLGGLSENLPNLVYLNVRCNKITKVRQFRKISPLSKLETLILLENPLYEGKKAQPQDEEDEDQETTITSTEPDTENTADFEGSDVDTTVKSDPFKIHLLVLLPSLKRINKEFVTLNERDMAEKNSRKLLAEIFEEQSSEDESEVPTTSEYTTDYTTETEVDEKSYGDVEANDEVEEKTLKTTEEEGKKEATTGQNEVDKLNI